MQTFHPTRIVFSRGQPAAVEEILQLGA